MSERSCHSLVSPESTSHRILHLNLLRCCHMATAEGQAPVSAVAAGGAAWAAGVAEARGVDAVEWGQGAEGQGG